MGYKKLLCDGDLIIPTPDNTPIECEGDYKNGDCVLITELSEQVKTYFVLPDSPTLTQTLNNLALSLIDTRQRLINLENGVTGGTSLQILEEFTSTEGQADFTVTNTVLNSLPYLVFRQGQKQVESDDFALNINTFSFNTPRVAGEKISIIYYYLT